MQLLRKTRASKFSGPSIVTDDRTARNQLEKIAKKALKKILLEIDAYMEDEATKGKDLMRRKSERPAGHRRRHRVITSYDRSGCSRCTSTVCRRTH